VVLDELEVPIVLAPLAGGPSTPELAAAVAEAGGLGFLGAGYLTADALEQRITVTCALTTAPFGVNVFVINGGPTDPSAYEDYVASLTPEAERLGVEVGEPRFDDDEFDAKVDVLVANPVSVVSFTFGIPHPKAVDALRAAGSEIWMTATNANEAKQAVAAGADVLVAQGAEAGGHRGSFDDARDQPMVPVVTLLEELGEVTDLPLVGAGGLATDVHVKRALDAGAVAAAAGTAFMLAPEAGTSEVHRQQLTLATPTALTRAFTGRLARGIRNRFLLEHVGAPTAYPEIHYATAPLRAAARKAGDPDVVNLWAGTRHALTVERPAEETVAALVPR
jgi:nitronate monooxygenase